MNNKLRYILALCVAFSLYFIAKKTLLPSIFYGIDGIVRLYPLSYFTAYLIVGLPVLAFTFFTNGHKIFGPLGLTSGIAKGFLFSFAFSIPMFLGYGLLSGFQVDLEAKTFWLLCVSAAFFEEFYYRGFFFGQLYRNTRLGFLPSLVLGALVFASLHLYQSSNPSTLVGIFMTTFLGAAIFAWLFVEWNFNLWISIGLHFFMNLSWDLFSISDNALGDFNANIIRGVTILFAIVGTIVYKRKKQIPLAITRDTLVMNRLADNRPV